MALLFCGLATWSALGAESLLPPMNGQPGDFAPRRAGMEVNASLKISVTNEGLYRINQTALTAAGIKAADLIGSQIRMYCRTQEVAIFVSKTGLWTTTDYLVFYGTGFDGYYTAANVYWLGIGGAGKRMTTRSAAPRTGVPTVTSFIQSVTYHRDRLFRDLYRPEDEGFDHWLAETLTHTAATNLGIRIDQQVTTQSASLKATLYGYSSAESVNPDHHTRIKLNNTTIADWYFDGQNSFTGSCTFAGTLLRTNNTVSFQQVLSSGVTADQTFLERFSIEYTRNLNSVSSSLIFSRRSGTNNFRVGSFSNPNYYWVVDVSDSASPVMLQGYQITKVSGKYSVLFSDVANNHRYAVYHASAFRTVAGMTRCSFRDLASTNRQADYIVICPYSLRWQVYRLLERRYAQGLKVVVAPLGDIQNEFSYGIYEADAIKQFLGYAFHHWQSPPPRYVLLAGNGSYDPKGNMKGISANDSYAALSPVPVHMGPSVFKWTAQDGWYVQVNGTDNLPDMALGRIPVENETQLGRVVDKIVALESASSSDWRRTEALLVADKKDGIMDFKGACESINTSYLAPAGFFCTTAYSDNLNASTVRQIMLNTINGGAFLTYYFGHGAMDQLGMYDVFNTNDVAILANSFFPVFSMLTCESGFFQSPTDKKSMVEALLERSGRGSAACVASSALTQQPYCEEFAKGFSESFVTDQTERIGDAFLWGCRSLYDYDPWSRELLFLEVFGDPAMIVNPQ